MSVSCLSLGSARVLRAVFGALAEKSLPEPLPFGEAPNGAREGARAPQT